MSSLKSILTGRIGEKGKEAEARQAVEKAVMQSALVWNQEIGTMELALYDAESQVVDAEGDPRTTVATFLRLQRTVAALKADVTAAKAAQTARFAV